MGCNRSAMDYNCNMDNLSHAMIGLAVGEVVHNLLPALPNEEDQRLRRRLLLTVSALAGNFPDLDLVLTPLLPAPLGYLLHHRGHTHTFLYAIPQAILLGGLIAFFWKRARSLMRRSASTFKAFLFLLGFGFVLHLGLDSFNSYGIHPFYPFQKDWYFGDAVFIVEPLFWIVTIVPLAMGWSARWRWGVYLFFTGLLGYLSSLGYLSWLSLVFLGALGSGLTFMRQSKAVASGLAIVLVYVRSLFAGSFAAKERLAAAINQGLDNYGFQDASLSSYPANPGCWMFTALAVDRENSRYRIEKGTLSLFPQLFSAGQCPRALQVSRSNIYPLDGLQQNYERNCWFEAWMRFARMPATQGQTAWDERFQDSDEPELNFTYVDLDAFSGRECPQSVPAWGAPRLDILR